MCRIVECPHDVEERVGLPEAGQLVGGKLLGADPALARGGRRRQIHVRHVGLHDLLGLEDLREAIEPRVGDLDHADVERDAAVAACLGVSTGQRVEDGRLAAPGKPDDRDLHVSSRRPDRRR